MSLEKSKLLLEEAEKDIENGCFNKAVSASYFASRMILEIFFRDLGIVFSKKDDKMINILASLGLRKEASDLRVLFEMRKEADHRAYVFSEKEARYAFNTSKIIHDKIFSLLKAKRKEQG